MSGQANGQFPPNYQDFGGQPNQQVSGGYGQGNFSPNAPPVTRGSVRQVQPNFPQPAVSNPQQKVLQHQVQQQQMQQQQILQQQMSQQQMSQQQMSQQQMPRQTNPQPAAILHVNSQANYAPLTSLSHNNNDQSFSPQLGGEPDVTSSPHVNGQHLQPHQGGAQVAVQTPPSSTLANESTLEKILAELRTLNSMFQRQEADRAGIIFDNSRMYESIMSMAMKLVETVSAVGVNVQRQFSFQTARSLQNDAEANFNHLSGRYSTDGNGYISQSVTIDPQNIDPQNSNQQNSQNMNHPNLDPANMNNQNM